MSSGDMLMAEDLCPIVCTFDMNKKFLQCSFVWLVFCPFLLFCPFANQPKVLQGLEKVHGFCLNWAQPATT